MSITDPEEVKKLKQLADEVCPEDKKGDSNWAEKFDTLVDALEASEKNIDLKPSMLEIKDLMSVANNFLSEKARLILNKFANSLIEDDPEIGRCKCTYFTVKVKKENVELAVKEMCNIANKLEEDGMISSCLAPISMIELAKMPKEAPSVIVFFYPLVSVIHLEEIEKMKYNTKEGEVGETLGSLEKDLALGEFLAEIRISHFACMPNFKDETVNSILFDRINEYLSVLPKGTKVLDFEQCAITDLSVPYEIKFYNPIMSNYKEVELNYRREIAVVDGHMEIFNLLTGVTYIPRIKTN